MKLLAAKFCLVLFPPLFPHHAVFETPSIHVLTLVLKIQRHVYKLCTAAVYRSVLGLYFLEQEEYKRF